MLARRTTWRLVGVAATVITTNWVVLTYMVFNTELLDFIQLSLTPESSYYIYCQIISICVALWQSGSWIMPIVTNYVMTRTLTKSFQKLNKEMERGVSEGNRREVAPGKVVKVVFLIHQCKKIIINISMLRSSLANISIPKSAFFRMTIHHYFFVDIRYFRMRHDKISELARSADKAINMQASFILICNVVTICLALYTFIFIWVLLALLVASLTY